MHAVHVNCGSEQVIAEMSTVSSSFTLQAAQQHLAHAAPSESGAAPMLSKFRCQVITQQAKGWSWLCIASCHKHSTCTSAMQTSECSVARTFCCVRSLHWGSPEAERQQEAWLSRRPSQGPQPRSRGHAVHSCTLWSESIQNKGSTSPLLRGKVAYSKPYHSRVLGSSKFGTVRGAV
jgi:hypothetical protein